MTVVVLYKFKSHTLKQFESECEIKVFGMVNIYNVKFDYIVGYGGLGKIPLRPNYIFRVLPGQQG